MAVASIVTLTLNPALDVSSETDAVVANHKLRCSAPVYDPGGGGINVARVALRLGHEAIAVVPLGGGTGSRILELLNKEGIPLRSVSIESPTRESFTVGVAGSEDHYRFVLPGPEITSEELGRCRDAVVELAANAKCVVLSGSLPNSVPPEALGSLVSSLGPTRVLVDTSGPALQAALRTEAFLIKPSARELAYLVRRTLNTEAEVLEAAHQVLAESSVTWLAVSIGAGGAILVDRTGTVLRLRAPAVRVVSAVGAGDSMVAGIAVGLARGLEVAEAARLGIACGSATVMSAGTDLCDERVVDELLPLVVLG